MGIDGLELSCPGSSVVADDGDGEGKDGIKNDLFDE